MIEALMLLPPGTERPLAAGAVLLAYAGFCGWTWWRHRRRNRPVAAPQGGILVAHASQTGFAELLAERTVEALQAAGQAAWAAPLGGLDAAALAGAGRVLFVASTTGEGDAPDNVARFVSRTMAAPANGLAGLRYGVLALGDRSYRHYCAFAHALDGWLRHSGALPLFDLVEVDNGDGAALRHWQGQLAHLAGAAVAADWAPAEYQAWRLRARHHLNPGSPGGPVHHILLDPPDEAASWQAGDVAEIGPGNDPAAVQALLALLGLPADMEAPLSSARLPADPAEWQGLSPARIRERLEPLPHREYSIASIPEDGRLELVVRQVVDEAGRLGLGSGTRALFSRR